MHTYERKFSTRANAAAFSHNLEAYEDEAENIVVTGRVVQWSSAKTGPDYEATLAEVQAAIDAGGWTEF